MEVDVKRHGGYNYWLAKLRSGRLELNLHLFYEEEETENGEETVVSRWDLFTPLSEPGQQTPVRVHLLWTEDLLIEIGMLLVSLVLLGN